MFRRCIINFAKGDWYPKGQARLSASLEFYGEGITPLLFSDECQIGCPAHSVAPYAFKVYAFREAVRQGFESILWLDASIWAVRDLDPLFREIETTGHAMFDSGFNCAQWTNDRMLDAWGVTRDEAAKVTMMSSGCLGLNFATDKALTFLNAWERLIPCFRGSWKNEDGMESKDPRCHGHRHDQSAASLIADYLGMGLLIPHETFFQYWYGDAGKIGANVSLLAGGM